MFHTVVNAISFEPDSTTVLIMCCSLVKTTYVYIAMAQVSHNSTTHNLRKVLGIIQPQIKKGGGQNESLKPYPKIWTYSYALSQASNNAPEFSTASACVKPVSPSIGQKRSHPDVASTDNMVSGCNLYGDWYVCACLNGFNFERHTSASDSRPDHSNNTLRSWTVTHTRVLSVSWRFILCMTSDFCLLTCSLVTSLHWQFFFSRHVKNISGGDWVQGYFYTNCIAYTYIPLHRSFSVTSFFATLK
jgi:hypothetical protein